MRKKNIPLFVCVIILLFCFFSSFSFSADWVICSKVIDGDTIRLENGEKVRLIGVDTPEFFHPTKPVQFYTKEATTFTRELIEGKKVRLEYDEQKRDKYDRLLCYVYLEDGTFVNAEIIRKGYGFAYTKYPFKHLDQFEKYEKSAREQELGLWKGKGELEFLWLEKQGRKPFKIYEMANSLWGIRYEEFIKPRVTSEDLVRTLENLRQWVNEFSDRDLANQLYQSGWLKVK